MLELKLLVLAVLVLSLTMLVLAVLYTRKPVVVLCNGHEPGEDDGGGTELPLPIHPDALKDTTQPPGMA